MNNEDKNAVQQMAEKIMPGFRTDHGGINLGDIVVLLLSSVLLIYTGYRSWHFLSLSIPADFQILALVGLWGIDIAMVGWAVTWIFGSSSPGQDGVSMTMWVIDVIAMVLTSVIDTIMYADGGAIPPIMRTVAWWGVPLIIVGNATMAIIYHFTSPQTKHRRQKRRLEAEMREVKQKGDAEIERMEMTANILKENTLKRASALLSISSTAEQNTALVELEQQVIRKLNQSGMNGTGFLNNPSFERSTSVQDENKQDTIQAAISKIQGYLGKNHQSEYALPCGHTSGAQWNKHEESYVCNICDAPVDFNQPALVPSNINGGKPSGPSVG